MSELTEAEGFLLEQIRKGSPDAWRQMVSRYQGRLVSFARSRIRQTADAEDLVQEAFVGFLKGLPGFRGEASLETYLFTILRRKIINWTRGRQVAPYFLQDVVQNGVSDSASGAQADAMARLAAPDQTASWYVRRNEAHEQQRAALTHALRAYIDGLKESENLRDLKVIELLFYCRVPNKDVGGMLSLNEKHVALIKHRALRQIRESVSRILPVDNLSDAPRAGQGESESSPADTMIAEIWRALRLSCPKRSTIGAYVLGTLERPWLDYVTFHLDRLGCEFCRANWDDLRRQTSEDELRALRQRIMESTVGFLSSP
jgi:RNA polymerase sigma factor (sigma-70 family)